MCGEALRQADSKWITGFVPHQNVNAAEIQLNKNQKKKLKINI